MSLAVDTPNLLGPRTLPNVGDGVIPIIPKVVIVFEEFAAVRMTLHVFDQLDIVAVFPVRFPFGLEITKLNGGLRAEKTVYVWLVQHVELVLMGQSPNPNETISALWKSWKPPSAGYDRVRIIRGLLTPMMAIFRM